MREGKLRAWDERRKTMEYFTLVTLMKYGGNYNDVIMGGKIMWYTGLKDKNGGRDLCRGYIEKL